MTTQCVLPLSRSSHLFSFKRQKIAKTDDKNCPVYMPDINDVVFTGLDGKANDAINYSVVKGSDSERDHKKKILHFMPPVPV